MQSYDQMHLAAEECVNTALMSHYAGEKVLQWSRNILQVITRIVLLFVHNLTYI